MDFRKIWGQSWSQLALIIAVFNFIFSFIWQFASHYSPHTAVLGWRWFVKSWSPTTNVSQQQQEKQVLPPLHGVCRQSIFNSELSKVTVQTGTVMTGCSFLKRYLQSTRVVLIWLWARIFRTKCILHPCFWRDWSTTWTSTTVLLIKRVHFYFHRNVHNYGSCTVWTWKSDCSHIIYCWRNQ